VQYTKKLLEEAGIEPERVEMYNMSASMGPRFAEVADEMTELVRRLGPSPLRKDVQPKARVEAAVSEKGEGESNDS
jgi:coenzyme F420-reducing hydrogenase delta subunit